MTRGSDILTQARQGLEAATAGRVFGAPIDRDGVTIVPVAVVSGGAGSGGGKATAAATPSRPDGDGSAAATADQPDSDGSAAGGPDGDGSTADQPDGDGSAAGGEADRSAGQGSGGGFGFSARPAGVYVIKDGEVTWRPAVNVNAIVAGGQLVLLAALLVARSVLRRRG